MLKCVQNEVSERGVHTRREKRGTQGIVTHGTKRMDNIVQKEKRLEPTPLAVLCLVKNDAEQVDNGGRALHGHLCTRNAVVVR